MDYFNDTEREGQLRFAQKRDRMFMPLLKPLLAVGARPNHVSVAGLILLAVATCLPPSWFPLFCVLMLLYVLADGLDGCLARLTGSSSEAGSIVDIVVDQAGPVFISAASAWHLGSNPVAAVLFSNSYLVFIGLALYANTHNIPIGYYWRVKYLFYIVYFVSIIIMVDLAVWFMAGFGAYYIFSIFRGLLAINRHYAQPGPSQETGVQG
jgi:phosphatidylglycerophosphate synthase